MVVWFGSVRYGTVGLFSDDVVFGKVVSTITAMTLLVRSPFSPVLLHIDVLWH